LPQLATVANPARLTRVKARYDPDNIFHSTSASARGKVTAALHIRSNSGAEPAVAKEGDMPVFSIWESRFPSEHVERGRAVTEAIWHEMPAFPGYLRHAVVEDVDDPGHLFVVSEWESREAADKVLADYADSPNAAWPTTSSPSRAAAPSAVAWNQKTIAERSRRRRASSRVWRRWTRSPTRRRQTFRTLVGHGARWAAPARR
jgi:quinol monooxygenase YgiN